MSNSVVSSSMLSVSAYLRTPLMYTSVFSSVCQSVTAERSDELESSRFTTSFEAVPLAIFVIAEPATRS